MTYELAPAVEAEVVRVFPAELVSYVRRQLAETALPWDQSACVPRVHIAVIWLSGGDAKRFAHELGGACADWRDTLCAAGLANEDWRQVLAARGVDCRDW